MPSINHDSAYKTVFFKMIPYSFLFVLVGSGLLAARAFGVRWLYYVVGAALAIFSGLRDNIGVDYESYANSFSEIRQGVNLRDFEPLNMGIINFVNLLGGGDYLIFLSYSIITLSGVLYFSKRTSNSKELSVFIFMTLSIFYFSTFNLMRQWAAISMILFSITSLIDKKYYRMVAFIALASMFHLSALMMVVIPFLTIRFSKKWVLVMMLSSVLLAEFAFLVIEQLPYIHYLNEVFRSDRTGSLPMFLSYILFLILMLLKMGYFNIDKQLARHELVILNMCLLSIFVLLIGFLMGLDFQTTMRANAYFTIQVIILLPWLLKEFDRFSQYIVYPFCILALSGIYWGTLIFRGEDYMLTPFVFVGLLE